MSNLLSRELMEKAGAAETAEELLALAKENGVNMSENAAKEYFARIHKTGEVSDEELDNVAGGGCQTRANMKVVCEKCGAEMTWDTEVVPPYGTFPYVCPGCGNKKQITQ